MPVIFRNTGFILGALGTALTLAGCGGGGGGNADGSGPIETLQVTAPAPPPPKQTFSGTEDQVVRGFLSKLNLPAGDYHFDEFQPPQHGSVSISEDTGEFAYTPDPDYFGTDSFVYRVSKTVRQPLRGQVVIDLTNVNDAPVLAAIDDMMNSAESHDSTYALPVTEVDGDTLQVTVTSEDPAIATVSGNGPGRTIQISPVQRGSTKIRVSVSDGEFTTSEQEFEFTVGDVTKSRVISADMSAGEAITFTNVTSEPIPLTFEHNGFPLFHSDQEVVDYVAQMPEQVPGESFPRKLWRFIRDSTYHNVPLTNEQWFHDSWALLVSQGWGFCSHVSAAYVRLARAAGFEARVWGLTGHVVPEVKIDGEWQMFDPDLSVYYFKPDSKIAGVADLAADQSLITSPVNAVLADHSGVPFSQLLADIYGSPSNNFLGDHVFLPEHPAEYQPLVLPPGSRFTYPGRWTTTLTGLDGDTAREIPYYLQGQLLTPAGWTGTIALPWMIWEVRGTGRVRVLDQDYDIGSEELRTLLQNPGRQIPNIEILSATSDIRIVVFVNAMRYALTLSNNVSLTGKDVWGVQVGTRLLSEESRANAIGTIVYKKPSF